MSLKRVFQVFTLFFVFAIGEVGVASRQPSGVWAKPVPSKMRQVECSAYSALKSVLPAENSEVLSCIRGVLSGSDSCNWLEQNFVNLGEDSYRSLCSINHQINFMTPHRQLKDEGIRQCLFVACADFYAPVLMNESQSVESE